MEIQDRTNQRYEGGESNPGKPFQPLAPQQFVDIIEHMNDVAVVLDKNWYYVYVNQKAALMLRRRNSSDLIGKHIWTEFPEDGATVYPRGLKGEDIPISARIFAVADV